jgi:hypothetical protein
MARSHFRDEWSTRNEDTGHHFFSGDSSMQSSRKPRWLQRLFGSWFGRRPRTAVRPSLRDRTRLQVEHLETRLTPSTFTVTNPYSSGVGSLPWTVAQADADTSHAPVIINFAPSLSAAASSKAER